MLKQSGLSAAENRMFTDEFAERLRYEIDSHWQGEMDGTTSTIEGVADLASVSAWLNSRVPAGK